MLLYNVKSIIDLIAKSLLAECAYGCQLDVLSLTETWYTKKFKNEELFRPDLNVIRAERPAVKIHLEY